MGGGVLLNKVLSIVLILTILIIPFSFLLNVKAEGVTVTVDDSSPLESDSNFKRVTNTAELYISRGESENEFVAYKILDIYYNQNSNEMTYDFTSNFQSFINQLEEDDDFYNLSASSYQELTSDNTHDTTIHTASTLNKLVSKYATYVKKNSITGINSFAKTDYLPNGYTGNLLLASVEAGAYLIIPSKVIAAKDSEIYALQFRSYGVGVANVVFQVENGNWTLPYFECIPKSNRIEIVNYLANLNHNELLEYLDVYYDLTYSANKDLLLISTFENTEIDRYIPTNTNSSILNNSEIMKKIGQREFIFPEGITLDKIYYLGSGDIIEEAVIRNNKLYFMTGDRTEVRVADITDDKVNNKLVFSNVGDYVDMTVILKLKVNDKVKVGIAENVENLADHSNVIVNNNYYLKDAYLDIAGMDQATAEEAVIGLGTLTNTVHTLGVKVTNKVDTTLLNGAKFQVCLDKNCTNKVGEEFEITENGTYTFKGLNDTDTYYLKQTKASTGYKLLSDAIELNPTNLNKEVGLYNVEVTNTKMGLLPSTGGLGTILYTTFGLLIIVVGSIFFISYRKRQVNN